MAMLTKAATTPANGKTSTNARRSPSNTAPMTESAQVNPMYVLNRMGEG